MPKLGKGQRRRRETVYGEVYDPSADFDPLPEPPKKTAEQLENLHKKIRTTAFLKELDEKRLNAALSHMWLQDVKAGEVIFKQGEPGHHFYIVESGSLEIYDRDEDDERCSEDLNNNYDEKNPCIGEINLLYAAERPHSVKAETDCQLWVIDRKLYTRVVVKMAYERRQRHMEFLASVPMLESLLPYERVRLCDAMDLRKYKEGEEIVKSGSKADGMFFVEEGEVEFVKKSELGEERQVLEEADFFGELSLLSKLPRNFACTAKTDCEVTFLEAAAFERLLGKCKKLMSRNPAHYKEFCKKEFGTENPDEKIIR